MILACHECSKEISHTAGSCPNCGSKKPFADIKLKAEDIKGLKSADRKLFKKSGGEIEVSYKKDSYKKQVFSALAIFIIFFIVMTNQEANMTSQKTNMTPEESAALAVRRVKERAAETAGGAKHNTVTTEKRSPSLWIIRGKKFILARLKDPDSAEFRNATFHEGTNGTPVTCGQVNSKNSFGGYTGFQAYISFGSPDLTYLQSEFSDFDATWIKFCQG